MSKLTPADCAAFHRKVFVPNNAIVALVGDFDSKTVIAELKRLTAGWKKTDLKHPELPPIEKPKAFTQKILTMPEASQLNVYLGQVGVRRTNPDYYKLLVMDYILGTGSGFTDRLSSRLRDREGLAYTVSASITSTAGDEPGLFMCYIGTFKQHFATVKKMFLEELNAHSRHEADRDRAGRREGLPDRQPVAGVRHERGHRRPVADDRAIQAGLRLPGGLSKGRAR